MTMLTRNEIVELTPTARELLKLLRYPVPRRTVYTIAKLAAKLGCTRMSVYNAVKLLVERGVIGVIRRPPFGIQLSLRRRVPDIEYKLAQHRRLVKRACDRRRNRNSVKQGARRATGTASLDRTSPFTWPQQTPASSFPVPEGTFTIIEGPPAQQCIGNDGTEVQNSVRTGVKIFVGTAAQNIDFANWFPSSPFSLPPYTPIPISLTYPSSPVLGLTKPMFQTGPSGTTLLTSAGLATPCAFACAKAPPCPQTKTRLSENQSAQERQQEWNEANSHDTAKPALNAAINAIEHRTPISTLTGTETPHPAQTRGEGLGDKTLPNCSTPQGGPTRTSGGGAAGDAADDDRPILVLKGDRLGVRTKKPRRKPAADEPGDAWMPPEFRGVCHLTRQQVREKTKEFIRRWCKRYREMHKTFYMMAWGRDNRAAQRLVMVADGDVDWLMKIAERLWADGLPDRFLAEQSHSIHGLHDYYNEIMGLLGKWWGRDTKPEDLDPGHDDDIQMPWHIWTEIERRNLYVNLKVPIEEQERIEKALAAGLDPRTGKPFEPYKPGPFATERIGTKRNE